MEICPSCKKECKELRDVSRWDDQTLICHECGLHEAFDEYLASPVDFEEKL
jgi:hypothetical protein